MLFVNHVLYIVINKWDFYFVNYISEKFKNSTWKDLRHFKKQALEIVF